MNPIGDTMIDAQLLIDLYNDPNASVFTVLSQLLSLNNFEFFPLQNFMNDPDSWANSFKIDTSGNIKKRPAFVCMYIGGTSSYPSTTSDNGFLNDGIIDISNTDAADFTNNAKCIPNSNLDNQMAKNDGTFPYRQVRAFRVKFGEQNQSMFTDIKIDSKEYPETNESLQILARLAGDNQGTTAIPKGQNLYNLYENRSYKATITGLGNVMIQPTQYFQLENVPLFNGAYVILAVEHTISTNKMTTNFSGVKIMKYPQPRVTNPLAFMGYDGGASNRTNLQDKTSGELTAGFEAITMSLARLNKLNSVFGIDVSHYQPNFNWNKAVSSSNTTDPPLKFAIIKASQGTFVDSKSMINATNAKAAGLKIGYYHFADQYTGSDIVGNAKTQADFFIKTVQNLPKPDFPLMLDMEDNSVNHKSWSLVKTDNDLWINTFISELNAAKYVAGIYCGKPWIDAHTSNNFGSIPLWHAQYPNNPEWTDPTIASGWNDWSIWQFSSQGRITGNAGNVDLNAMRAGFFNLYNA